MFKLLDDIMNDSAAARQQQLALSLQGAGRDRDRGRRTTVHAVERTSGAALC